MTRPFVLHENRRAAIIALAEFGISNRAIARHVCCAPATIRNTAQRDPAFRQELETARFKFVLNSHRVLHKQAAKSWRAANVLLERADPENFGRRRPDGITPAQQARQFKTWTRALADALPPEHRETIEREAARIAQALSAALDDDECPVHEYPDDFIPLDPTLEELNNIYNPPFPPIPPVVASAAAAPLRSVSTPPIGGPGQADEIPAHSTVPSYVDVAPAAPSPVPPSTAAAQPRKTPRTHPVLVDLSDDNPDCPLAEYRRENADFHRPHTAREIRSMPDTQRTVDILNNEILILLSAGRKAEAIQFYRTASAISLAEARQAVEDIDTLRDKSRPTVRQTPGDRNQVAEFLAVQAKRRQVAGAQPPIAIHGVSDGPARADSPPQNRPADAPPQADSPGDVHPPAAAPSMTDASKCDAPRIIAPRIVVALLCGLLLGLLAGDAPATVRAAARQVIARFSPRIPAEVGNNPVPVGWDQRDSTMPHAYGPPRRPSIEGRSTAPSLPDEHDRPTAPRGRAARHARHETSPQAV